MLKGNSKMVNPIYCWSPEALLKNAEPPIEFMNRLSKDKGLANYVVGQFLHLLIKI